MSQRSNQIGEYLDQLGQGLSHLFPKEDFDQLGLIGRIGVVANLYDSAIKAYTAEVNFMPIEHQVMVTLRAEITDEPAELAKVTHQTRAGMTSTLDRLEKKKLLKRLAHELDRRKTRIQLTKKGEQMADAAILNQNQALESIFGHLSTAQVGKLVTGLDQLISSFTSTSTEEQKLMKASQK